VKKSVPVSSAWWLRMKAAHVVVRLRSGADGGAYASRAATVTCPRVFGPRIT